jgi:hypothetical protein
MKTARPPILKAKPAKAEQLASQCCSCLRATEEGRGRKCVCGRAREDPDRQVPNRSGTMATKHLSTCQPGGWSDAYAQYDEKSVQL